MDTVSIINFLSNEDTQELALGFFINKKFMEGDPDSKYYIVFFTDGIDNASATLANRTRRGTYPVGTAGRDAYGNSMRDRMGQILKKHSFFGLIKKPNTTNTFQSYVLLYKGQDLESYSEDALNTILQPFTASQNAPTPPVIVSSDMTELYDKFTEAFTIPLFSFSIPQRLHRTKDTYVFKSGRSGVF